jgi:branched-chain amino acid transport system substrate-binding protein
MDAACFYLFILIKEIMVRFCMLHSADNTMKITFRVLIVFIVMAAIPACQQVEVGQRPVRIGVIAYTEDQHKEGMGIPTVNAARMAVEEINNAGGVRMENRLTPIELIVEGVASSPQRAVASMRKLTNRQNVSAIVGLHYSVDAIPAGAFADKAQIPFISPMSTNSNTTHGRDYVFRMSFLDERQGSVMARFAYHGLGSRRAAVMFDRTDPYSSGIAEVFSTTYLDLGGAVVSYQPFVRDTVDYHQTINLIKTANPDVLYLPGFAADVQIQAQIARENGLNVRLLGADGWDAIRFSQEKVFNNSYMTTHWVNSSDFAGAADFTANYQGKYNTEPGAVAALTYDAMKFLFRALEYSGSRDGASLRKAMIAMDPYDGVAGTVDFIENGDPVKGVVVLNLQERQVALEKIVQRGEY